MLEELGSEMKTIRIRYDGEKHRIKFENQQRRTRISTIENKKLIVI